MTTGITSDRGSIPSPSQAWVTASVICRVSRPRPRLRLLICERLCRPSSRSSPRSGNGASTGSDCCRGEPFSVTVDLLYQSSLGIHALVRLAQPNHDSAYDDQGQDDKNQLYPAEGRSYLDQPAPIDFVAGPAFPDGVCEQRNPSQRRSQISHSQQQRRRIGNLSNDVPEVNERIFDAALELEQELGGGIRDLLEKQVIHIGRAPHPLTEDLTDSLARFFCSLCRIDLILPGNVDLGVQPRNDRIIKQGRSEQLDRLERHWESILLRNLDVSQPCRSRASLPPFRVLADHRVDPLGIDLLHRAGQPVYVHGREGAGEIQ